jgi:hypothetical protein
MKLNIRWRYFGGLFVLIGSGKKCFWSFDFFVNKILIYSYDKPVRKSKSKKTSPLVVQSHYQNLTFDDRDGRDQHEVDEEDEDHTYLNIRTYDIPRSATNIYDQPRINGSAGGGNNLNHVNNNNNLPPPLDSSDYDYPKGLIPLSARLLLNASRKHLHHYDADSLDGDQSPGRIYSRHIFLKSV